MYKIEDIINKIHCVDCLEFMKEMPDGCVDLCIADPPFNVGKDYGNFDDRKSRGHYWKWIEKRIKQIVRVLKNDTRFYIFHTDHGIYKLKPICEKEGFIFRQQLIWYGPNLGGAKIKADWAYSHEIILLFHKGKPKKTEMINAIDYSTTFSVQVHSRPQRNYKGGRDHPAQKPVSLLAAMISRTPGQIILDPFCGVGTALIAAKNLKRDFIGIEISEEYCAIARERLAQEVL